MGKDTLTTEEFKAILPEGWHLTPLSKGSPKHSTGKDTLRAPITLTELPVVKEALIPIPKNLINLDTYEGRTYLNNQIDQYRKTGAKRIVIEIV